MTTRTILALGAFLWTLVAIAAVYTVSQGGLVQVLAAFGGAGVIIAVRAALRLRREP